MPAGATLDLGGLKLYATTLNIAGTVTGGTVQQVGAVSTSLTIRLLSASVEISWPTSAGGYALEVTDELAAGVQWQKVTNAPVVVGPDNTVTQSLNDAVRFYRLHAQ